MSGCATLSTRKLGRRVSFAGVLLASALTLAGCSDSGTGPVSNDGPWIGSWVQVNWLATDDGGVWDEDDLTGIGFVAEITDTEWIETDGYGAGCSVSFSYSVDRNRRFSKQAVRLGPGCPNLPLNLLNDSGRLEFSADERFMIEHFDLRPGDGIAAFKWMRRTTAALDDH